MLVVSAPGRARAGTVEVSLLDRDIRYTLFTVEREQTEFFHFKQSGGTVSTASRN